MRLADRVAIITGSCSGIGRATAYLFAKEGAKIVVVCDRNEAGGKETVANIEANGGEAIFVHTDISVASEVEHLVKATVDRFGKVDILFNNAGTYLPFTPVDTIDEAGWDHVYAVDVKGIFLGAKYAVPEMRKTGGGVIINTGSTLGVRPGMKNSSAYASSKGALNTLTKALAVELAPDNIRVNCINPTAIESPIFSEEQRKAVESHTPLGRMAKAQDIAYAALYLASDESSMITGISLNVDGGGLT
jgi:NAD(P)-dependent dehydrogenase (short-subunit alcohol dehydrogenase family)